jgi:hypothetical protein
LDRAVSSSPMSNTAVNCQAWPATAIRGLPSGLGSD